MLKKIVSWALVIAMTAAIAVGGTMAYLTDTDEDVNVMTLGNVKIDQLEYERVDTETKDEDTVVQEFHDNKPLYPAVTEDGFNWEEESTVDWTQIGKDGYTSNIWDPDKINNELDKMVFVKNKGTYDAYVRSVFAFEANGYTLEQFKALFHLNINEEDWTWEWEEEPVSIPGDTGATNYIIATATYNKVLKPGQLTEISLSQIALDPSADNADIAGFGDTYQVLVKTQAVQAEGFDDPKSALDEGFGEPTVDNIPWENDSAIRGIDLRTALHYLNGDTTQKITKKITNVIFGLNSEYPQIINTYDGTLVDVEQDVDVYAYYVPNGTNYDVYFLANSDIYTPVNSAELMNGMTALTKVDTTNLNVSRTEDMTKMFMGCTVLSDIDVSRWDTSNVTSLFATFANCKALTEPDMDEWDTSNVTTLRALFSGCNALKYVDVGDWNTSKVTDMKNIFNACYKLTEVAGIGSWDTSNVTDMTQAFMDCVSLATLDVSDWDVGKVTRFKATFATTAQNTGKMQLTDLDVTDWDVSSVTDLEAMFYGCGQITSMDLSKWDVSKVTKAAHMFSDCYKLETINVSGWNTSSLTCLDAMFNDCRSLKVIDVSSFTTDKVKEFSQMFEVCTSLEKIIGLENWNTTSGQDFSEMFHGCSSLKELDLSSFDTRQSNAGYITYYPSKNCMFERFLAGCTSLEKISFSANVSFDGDGSCPAGYKLVMPASTGVNGWDGNWYHAATGEAFAPADIPEETAATYVAVNPNP